MTKHTPVLLHEVIEYLKVAPNGIVVDATLDGGGHARAILERNPGARVIGIEWDPVLLEETKEELEEFGERFQAVNDNYVNLEAILSRLGVVPDSVLFDLGLSSWHFEASGRGFSFKKDEPLDMRFHPAEGTKTAAEIVNMLPPEDLITILREYGEEEFAEDIGRAIVQERGGSPIVTTGRLVQIIEGAVPEWYKHRKIHCATKTFQALRVAVNDELMNVRRGVQAAINAVRGGGRVAVISFQGAEDKAVREVFKENVTLGAIAWVTKDTIRPTWEEIKRNPRARSAKMKIAEKLGVPS